MHSRNERHHFMFSDFLAGLGVFAFLYVALYATAYYVSMGR